MRKWLIAGSRCSARGAADAQPYPSRTVTAIVPASAGGPTDTIGRIVMARAQQLLAEHHHRKRRRRIRHHRHRRVVRAEPDGYTSASAA